MGTLKFNQWQNPDGTENFKCRAWVNFNGTGTVAIRASGNVSSITDNGTGDYTVNFTNALPDANYSICGLKSYSAIANSNSWWVKPRSLENILTTGVRLHSGFTSGGGTDLEDSAYNAIAIFR
jgi:hypothetical protein